MHPNSRCLRACKTRTLGHIRSLLLRSLGFCPFSLSHTSKIVCKDATSLFLSLQTQNRMKLMSDNYDDDHLKVSSPNTEQPNNHKPSPDQVPMPPFWAKPPLNQNQTPTILTKPPLSFSFRCQHAQKYFCYLDFFPVKKTQMNF